MACAVVTLRSPDHHPSCPIEEEHEEPQFLDPLGHILRVVWRPVVGLVVVMAMLVLTLASPAAAFTLAAFEGR
jgi:hypothetical protein